ncbi:uncharacterized protein BDZ99DRAFT_251851 [Mytilinidion resinicola]|uniref:DEAD/DEAH box helicase domain-containing protein n=1 Tax=Mytilinidion resinicola TaxID=574789 RepID=A0A6A6YWB0_9PEZI|nr:uncharacterized protein BDZ99DRAFT_251851 [Mytilinidion resinicola]KAF2813232.1 hypothetical protein BDZ99DRAFT_251851 [Mytilinidion resinicola]
MLDASKRGQMRRKSETDLLAVARRLYNAPDLQFRVPGQRNGVLPIMGPQPAEQVVLVIGTGSGKTLVVMIGAQVNLQLRRPLRSTQLSAGQLFASISN